MDEMHSILLAEVRLNRKEIKEIREEVHKVKFSMVKFIAIGVSSGAFGSQLFKLLGII